MATMCMTTTPRVGIVGFGEIAQAHVRHLTRCGAVVSGVVTSRPTPPGLQRFASLAQMLPHVDAVTIAVPNHLHAGLCLQSIAAGKAAFVEKPLCLTADELAALERAIPTVVAPVHVGYRLRWNPALRALKARVTPVREVRCTYRLGIEPLALHKPWTRQTIYSGGAFWTLGVHALDLARFLAGAQGEPLAKLRASTSVSTPAADFPLVASLDGILPNGVRIEATADLRGDAAFRLAIVIDGEIIDLSRPDWPSPAPEHYEALDSEYAGLMEHFVTAIGARTVDRIALLEILETHRELIAATSS
jgi:predicted dehydrogenase